MKVRKRAQQRWSRLRLCTLSSKCVLPSVTHPVTPWADFVTHANACYMDAIIRTGPSVALYPEPSDLT